MKKIPRIIIDANFSCMTSRDFLLGVVQYSEFHGPWAFHFETGENKKNFDEFGDLSPDAIILTTDNKQKIKKLLKTSLPAIIVQGEFPEIFGAITVQDDNSEIGRMAAEYFLDRGFKHLAFCGFADRFWSKIRGKVFAAEATKAGMECYLNELPHASVEKNINEKQDLITKWLRSLPKPVGLLVCDDNHARRIIEICKLAGIHVPYEIAILGVDSDVFFGELSLPPLSSIEVNAKRAGYEAAELLDKMFSGRDVSNKIITTRATHITTRQSSDILAIEDKEVAAAVRYIRQHSRKLIQVDDIAKEVAVSRRTLERRFRRVLNRSLHEEIRRIRVGQAVKMLVETNMSITQIASSMGYSNLDISRLFQKEKKMSPLAYRKTHGKK